MREATRGTLEIVLRGGQRRALRIDHPLGHPSRPLDQGQLVAKFVDCAARAALPLSRERAQLAADAILDIDRADSAQHALAFVDAARR
jgi:2-methylcitrate dehydratase PrpD